MLRRTVIVGGMLNLAILCLNCSPPNHFISAGGVEKYEPRSQDHPIEVITADEPPRPYIVLGIVTGVSEGSTELIPLWQKLARENGGDAIWAIESRSSHGEWHGYPIYDWKEKNHYQAKVIRFKPE